MLDTKNQVTLLILISTGELSSSLTGQEEPKAATGCSYETLIGEVFTACPLNYHCTFD